MAKKQQKKKKSGNRRKAKQTNPHIDDGDDPRQQEQFWQRHDNDVVKHLQQTAPPKRKKKNKKKKKETATTMPNSSQDVDWSGIHALEDELEGELQRIVLDKAPSKDLPEEVKEINKRMALGAAEARARANIKTIAEAAAKEARRCARAINKAAAALKIVARAAATEARRRVEATEKAREAGEERTKRDTLKTISVAAAEAAHGQQASSRNARAILKRIARAAAATWGERAIKIMLNITTPQQSLPIPTTSRVPIPPNNPKSPRRHSRIPNPKSQNRHSRISPVRIKDGTEPTVPLLEKELGGAIANGETEGNGENKGCCSTDEGCGNSKGAGEGKTNNTTVNSAASMNKNNRLQIVRMQQRPQPPPERDRTVAWNKGCTTRANIDSRKGVLELGNSTSRIVSGRGHEQAGTM